MNIDYVKKNAKIYENILRGESIKHIIIYQEIINEKINRS